MKYPAPRFLVRSFAAGVFLFATGCSPTDSGADARDAAAETGGYDSPESELSGPCASGVIPTRFGFRWNEVNHRVSKWGIELREPATGECHPGAVRTTVVGGTFSSGGTERPNLEFAFQRRLADSPRRLGFVRRSLDVTLTPARERRRRVTFDRRALGLSDYSRVVALIDGFNLDTDIPQNDAYPEDYDPAAGYTLRSLAASVEVVSSTPRTLTLSYRLELQPGLSPDREPVNRAIPHARIDGRLDVLLAGTNDPVHEGRADYSASYSAPEPAQDDDFAPPPRSQRRVVVDGRAEAPRGLYGLSSFRFDLRPRIDCSEDADCPALESCRSDDSCSRNVGPPGFYVRELSVDLRMLKYNRFEGRGTFLLTGFASNSTKVVGFWPLTSRFRGSFKWIQTPRKNLPRRGTREFETGTKQFDLDEFGR